MPTNNTIHPLHPAFGPSNGSTDGQARQLIRLMHLMSPSLPTGGFAYSQGLEWAVEAGWVTDDISLKEWLSQLLCHSVSQTDVPVLKRVYAACAANDIQAGEYWVNMLLAMRETRELYLEEQNRGRALAAIIKSFDLKQFEQWSGLIRSSQVAGYAFAAHCWGITLADLTHGYLWAWLENQIMAGIKLIPLGQTQGHQLMVTLDDTLMAAATKGLALTDKDIGASMPAMAIGSCCHEHQYTRLFRS